MTSVCRQVIAAGKGFTQMVELLRGPATPSATPSATPLTMPSASPSATTSASPSASPSATRTAPAQESSERQSSSSGADTSVAREVEPEQRDGNNNQQEEEDDISQMAEFMRQRECHQLEELRREVMLVTVTVIVLVSPAARWRPASRCWG